LSRGKSLRLSVDALPGRSIEGTVVSVAPTSGSMFSLLPPDNATGNSTKIVQRVPVRIEVPVTVTEQHPARHVGRGQHQHQSAAECRRCLPCTSER
jgi:membrane fusion protein, multidrug efflux system